MARSSDHLLLSQRTLVWFWEPMWEAHNHLLLYLQSSQCSILPSQAPIHMWLTFIPAHTFKTNNFNVRRQLVGK